MKISLILAHPKSGSFNHAIAEVARETLKRCGHQVAFHDLYKERFDPILCYEEIPKGAAVNTVVQKHSQEIASVDGIIVVHPNWWGMPPAILKGQVDRVMRPGVAYEFLEEDSGEGVPRGLLKARKAIAFNTSNTFEERELHVFGDPLETLCKNCFVFTGKDAFFVESAQNVIELFTESRAVAIRKKLTVSIIGSACIINQRVCKWLSIGYKEESTALWNR